MEGLVVMLFGGQYKGRRVLITGHTGFKGSWLALWLTEMGAQVFGISLAPNTTPSHWNLLNVNITEKYVDIRNNSAVVDFINVVNPEVVFHLAAQPLVRQSYKDPIETWSTNVMGTANVLEACRQASNILAVVVVTTDKCYQNQEWNWGYRESDPLGGDDPYSASKAATELLVAGYRQSFFQGSNLPLIATARAGNVIGGGDWSEDRLIPDIVRAVSNGSSLEIRAPKATRPWQHVLESLSGYLLLGQKLLDGHKEMGGEWNFGPDQEGNISVLEVLTQLKKKWPELGWHVTNEAQPHEANLLYLDSSKAKKQLGWQPVWGIEETLGMTADWYRSYYESNELQSKEQLNHYIILAQKAGIEWSQ